MAKNSDQNRFFAHVAQCVERQLQEWDEHYEVMVAKMPDFFCVVRNKEQSIYFTISEKEARELQNQSPYMLDKKIWLELYRQGVKLQDGPGNYLAYVFNDKIPGLSG